MKTLIRALPLKRAHQKAYSIVVVVSRSAPPSFPPPPVDFVWEGAVDG